jgi:hypothetical protein
MSQGCWRVGGLLEGRGAAEQSLEGEMGAGGVGCDRGALTCPQSCSWSLAPAAPVPVASSVSPELWKR